MYNYERMIELAWREDVLFYLNCASPFVTILVFIGGYWVVRRVETWKRNVELNSKRAYCLEITADLRSDFIGYRAALIAEKRIFDNYLNRTTSITLDRPQGISAVVNTQLYHAIQIHTWKECLESDPIIPHYHHIQIAKAIAYYEYQSEKLDSYRSNLDKTLTDYGNDFTRYKREVEAPLKRLTAMIESNSFESTGEEEQITVLINLLNDNYQICNELPPGNVSKSTELIRGMHIAISRLKNNSNSSWFEELDESLAKVLRIEFTFRDGYFKISRLIGFMIDELTYNSIPSFDRQESSSN